MSETRSLMKRFIKGKVCRNEMGRSVKRMKKDFIVRRSITTIEGKPHVETYSEQELVRCKDCKYNDDGECIIKAGWFPVKPDWFCADGERGSK